MATETPTDELTNRIRSLEGVDGKLNSLLEFAKEILDNLEKDRQLSKNKFEECYKKFNRALEDINEGIGEQLAYIEEMCVGAEHQGSTFNIQQQVEFAHGSLDALRAEFRRVTDRVVDAGRDEQQPQNGE
ncbi:Protein MDT-11 [Aphelenchoides avenae]|nr:Protein MDT-11 [Aphelenchus avenae]